jgi:hypothetical protein
MAGALCYAENWNGKLIDATCYDSSGSKTTSSSDHTSRGKLEKECAPTAATNSFAIQTSKNTVYKLDSAGNIKAAEAMQAGSLKSDSDGDVHVSVAGTLQGNTVKVDSIQGKNEHH